MRVVWKDTKTFKSYRYRGHNIERELGGWVIDIPGDDNIYYSAEIAHNAIDEALGGKTRKSNPKRLELGIKIIGKRELRKDA